jgi:AcrR family transcriptional regulator
MSPRSKEASGKMREKTRKAILATSLELFAKHGYSATTTEQIATKARISKGLIFTHFHTKQDILFTILDEEIELVMPRFFSDDDARPAWERFTTLIDAWLKMIKEQPLYLRLSLQLSLDDEYRKLMKKKGKQYFEAMFGPLTRLITELGSDSPQLDCFLLMLTFDGIVANYTVAPELFPIDAIKDHLIATLTSRWKTGGVRRGAEKNRRRRGLTLK